MQQMKTCDACAFHHPERKTRQCSVFGTVRNKDGQCAGYIEAPGKESKADEGQARDGKDGRA